MSWLDRDQVRRGAAVLAGAWAGVLIGLAAIGTPAGFSIATKEVAGQLAGFMLTREAHASLVISGVLFLVVRHRARTAARVHGGSVLNAEVLLVLGALFCTVLGHFALQPAIAAAKAGQQGLWSFGALHAASVACFGLKTLLVSCLAWRFTRSA